MATLMQRPEVESEPAETMGDDKAVEQAEGPVRQKQNPRLLLTAGALLAGLSIALPAVILGIVYPLNKAEWRFVNIVGQQWIGEVWWSYVLTGVALSVVFSLTSIGLAIWGRSARSEADAYGATTTVVRNVNTSRLWTILANVALLFALLVAIFEPWAPDGEWVGVILIGAGLIAIAIGIRPVARAASRVLPFAMVAFMIGPWAIIPNNVDSLYISPDAGLGRILIGAGVVGIAVGVWGVSGSDPAVTQRWLLPFVFIASVLAMLGSALAYLMFALRNFSL